MGVGMICFTFYILSLWLVRLWTESQGMYSGQEQAKLVNMYVVKLAFWWKGTRKREAYKGAFPATYHLKLFEIYINKQVGVVIKL